MSEAIATGSLPGFLEPFNHGAICEGRSRIQAMIFSAVLGSRALMESWMKVQFKAGIAQASTPITSRPSLNFSSAAITLSRENQAQITS